MTKPAPQGWLPVPALVRQNHETAVLRERAIAAMKKVQERMSGVIGRIREGACD
ncbi:hypothetical protein ACIBH1_40190 [Nonomuraea sp. NPDC050663]|uniref:hypothetical protein n=1 Tax=Nonomuraea sp. NPDC050663 TaxID=3364370 RepID=UPI0037933DFF